MNSSNEPIYAVLKNYLTREGYRLDPKDLKLQLWANPSYPSIKSITDTLDYFGVENLAVQVPISSLGELPDYFLTTIQDEDGPKTVEVLKKGKRIIVKGQGVKERMTPEKFKVIWSGMVLAIEPKPQNNKVQVRNPIPFAVIAIGILTIAYFNQETWHELSYVLLSFLGGWFSYMAVREDLGIHNLATARICNSENLKTNCGEVINSTSSKVLGVKLTDASMAYFLAIILTVSFLGVDETYFTGLSLLSVPIVLYSLYAQAFVQKVWCPLCLAIGSVLLLMLTYSLVTFKGISDLSTTGTYGLQATSIMGLVYLIWLQIRKLIAAGFELEKVQMDFTRFKRNPFFFNHALAAIPFPNIIEQQPNDELGFGNPNARLVITGVTNPFCGYCKDSFEIYDQLLTRFPNQIKVRLVFYISPVMTEPDKYTIPGRVVELYRQDPKKAYRALQDWYHYRDIDLWKQSYGTPEHPEGHELLERHLNWSRTNGVTYTPVTILGDHVFPKEYEIDDLPMLLPDMLGQIETAQEPAY